MTDERPYPPHTLRERLLAASARHDGQALTQQQFDLARRLLDEACGAEGDRRAIMRWLFGGDWIAALSDSQTLAALDWLRRLELAAVEARLVLEEAIRESGARSPVDQESQ